MRQAWKSQLLLLLACSASLAQTSAYQQVNKVFALEQQGRYASAIALGQPLVDSKQISGVALGRTYTLLGMAYTQEDKLREAQNAFEQSVRFFQDKPEYKEDYAAALHSMAALYQTLGQLDIATRLDTKALHVYEQGSDHATIARVSSNLAGLAISQNQIGIGKKYLKKVTEESKLTNSLDNDDLATVSAMQGWLAVLHHDTSLAISNYQHALDLWKNAHGEDHLLTGWGYVLVGIALADSPDKSKALEAIRSGITILEHTVGRQNPKYFAAQVAYSYVLDANGFHAEAVKVKTAADQAMKSFYSYECASCTISVTALQ